MDSPYMNHQTKVETIGLVVLWTHQIFQDVEQARTVFKTLNKREHYKALNTLVKLNIHLDTLVRNIVAMEFPKEIELGLIQGSGAVRLMEEINAWIQSIIRSKNGKHTHTQ